MCEEEGMSCNNLCAANTYIVGNYWLGINNYRG